MNQLDHSPIRASIGQIYFNQAKYAEALEILKPGLIDTLADPIDKVITHTYLDTLQKLQQEDPTLSRSGSSGGEGKARTGRMV